MKKATRRKITIGFMVTTAIAAMAWASVSTAHVEKAVDEVLAPLPDYKVLSTPAQQAPVVHVQAGK